MAWILDFLKTVIGSFQLFPNSGYFIYGSNRSFYGNCSAFGKKGKVLPFHWYVSFLDGYESYCRYAFSSVFLSSDFDFYCCVRDSCDGFCVGRTYGAMDVVFSGNRRINKLFGFIDFSSRDFGDSINFVAFPR